MKYLFTIFIFCISLISSQTLIAAVQPVDFYGARAFSDAMRPYYLIKQADFDGDGKKDILAESADRMVVFHGDGNGLFTSTPVTVYNNFVSFVPVAIADFNSDGRDDIALPGRDISNNQPSITVFFGNANKTFSSPLYSNLTPLSSSMEAVDFDNDGKLDIIGRGPNNEENRILFYRGGGNGSFTLGGQMLTTQTVRDIALGDFNGDNLPDIAFGESDSLKIVQNTGGGFGTPVSLDTITFGFNGIRIADVNNDGKRDVVSLQNLSFNPSYVVWLGSGNFTFTGGQRTQVASSDFTAFWEITDIDNDQKPDLLMSTKNRMIFQHGNGNGSFTPGGSIVEGGGACFVADINADGRRDIVAAQSADFAVGGSGSFSVLLGTEFGDFKSGIGLPTGHGTKDIAVGDLDGNMLKDIVIVNEGGGGGPGEIVIVRQAAIPRKGLARQGENLSARTMGDSGIDPQAVVIGDFTGDNKRDIAVVGHGGFGAPVNLLMLVNQNGDDYTPLFSQINTGDIYGAAAGDLNLDGKLDLVTTSFTGLAVSFGAGNGTFAAPVNYLSGVATQRVVIADLNGDSKPDIAAINYNIDKVAILLNNGSGTFTAAANPAVTGDLNALAAADMNSDGKMDLVLAKGSGVSVLKGLGNGTFDAEVNYAISPGLASRIAAADFNGDGKTDVAVTASSNVTVVLLNDGTGALTGETLWGQGVEGRAIVAADMDNDDRTDLLTGFSTVSGSGEGFTKILYNITEAAVPRSVPFDFDGDGKSDISVFRPSNGYWYIQNSRDNSYNFPPFGTNGDLPAPADYDGDGKADVAVFRPSTGSWYFLRSADGQFQAVQFGTAGDIPVPADLDGDGKADVTVFRPSTGDWYFLRSTDGQFQAVHFGAAGDVPVAGDYDGDGKSDIAVWRPSTGGWYRLNSSTGEFVAVNFGLSEDRPTPADFDGDDQTDIAVFRPSNGYWYRLDSSTGAFSATPFGIAEDRPSAGDYDGDGKADIAVWRPSSGTWYLLRSTAGFTGQQFGQNGDIPTPGAFIR